MGGSKHPLNLCECLCLAHKKSRVNVRRQAALLGGSLLKDTAQNCGVLASCVSTAILESFLPATPSGWVVSGRVRETVENRGSLWPFCGQAPQNFYDFHPDNPRSL